MKSYCKTNQLADFPAIIWRTMVGCMDVTDDKWKSHFDRSVLLPQRSVKSK